MSRACVKCSCALTTRLAHACIALLLHIKEKYSINAMHEACTGTSSRCEAYPEPRFWRHTAYLAPPRQSPPPRRPYRPSAAAKHTATCMQGGRPHAQRIQSTPVQICNNQCAPPRSIRLSADPAPRCLSAATAGSTHPESGAMHARVPHRHAHVRRRQPAQMHP